MEETTKQVSVSWSSRESVSEKKKKKKVDNNYLETGRKEKRNSKH